MQLSDENAYGFNESQSLEFYEIRHHATSWWMPTSDNIDIYI